jgi:hypothetical protein
VNSTEIVVPDLALNLRMTREPQEIIKEAARAAKELYKEVARNNWAVNLGGKKPHIMFEGWALIATFYHVTARLVSGSMHQIQIGDAFGFQCEGEAFHTPSQTVISTATAICLNDEDNWGLRTKYEKGDRGERRPLKDESGNIVMVQTPMHHLMSMAETRAKSRALRAPFSWVIAMAGYEPTAAEDAGHPGIKQPQAKQTQGKITENQRKRLWAVGKSSGKGNEDILAIVKRYGFTDSNDVTLDKYDEIIAELEKSDAKED